MLLHLVDLLFLFDTPIHGRGLLLRSTGTLLFLLWLRNFDRAISDQLQQLSGSAGPVPDFVELRRIAAQHMRENPDEFAPFLGLDPSDAEYAEYCTKVESVAGAEWGGQMEIKALCAALGRRMLVYSADAPILRMGEESAAGGLPPIKLTYHRTYYALGEHYNSVAPITEDS
jgi:OTU domain-containing protein 6